jgi:hypothetical protein
LLKLNAVVSIALKLAVAVIFPQWTCGRADAHTLRLMMDLTQEKPIIQGPNSARIVGKIRQKETDGPDASRLLGISS